MKLSLPLFLCACAVPLSSAKNNLRPGNNGRRRKLNEACTGLIADVQYENGEGEEDEYLACETESGMTYRIKAADKNFLKNNFKNGGFKSGETELSFDVDAEVDEDTAEIFSRKPPGLKKKNKKGRRLYAELEGDVSVLVIRVIAANGSTGFTQEALSDSVFGNGADGNGADAVNLKSQYEECSHDKLRFQEAPNRNGNTISIANGATTVTVTTDTSQGDGAMRNAITAKLNSEFGVSNPNQLAKHVMYCLPANTMSGIAYAYINSWNSVYSNQWCTYLSAQMHEIGHNLNMAHSNEAGTYKDQSGMMGYSYSQNDGPRMCFNSAKSWQFGWYNYKELSLAGDKVYIGSLAPVLDDPNTTSDPMVIKIDNGSTDYFINFNRKAEFNSGTVEGGNQVLVTQAGNGNNYAESELKAKLSAGGSYSFTASGETVQVTVNSISTTNNGFADVSVCFSSGICSTPGPTAAPTPAITASPTQSPTAAPTASPTASPTAAPTASPTAVPTASPTAGPTAAPTSAPTVAPTQTPTVDPTASPTASPTAAPTVPLTPAPTEVPTQTPTTGPTVSPTSSPTAVPTDSPTDGPTASPTTAPTAVPTQTPTAGPTGVPTSSPTAGPTTAPTSSPTATPSQTPTAAPTVPVTSSPTADPTSAPTAGPTATPTQTPTAAPTTPSPTAAPTLAPTKGPTVPPTPAPTSSCGGIIRKRTCELRMDCIWKKLNNGNRLCVTFAPRSCGLVSKKEKCLANSCKWNGKRNKCHN